MANQPLRIAYFVNVYPAVSHAFIRREIHALERRGVEVLRVALRGWDGDVVDESDPVERERTRYVLRDGPLALLMAVLRTMVGAPGSFAAALWLAVRIGWRAARPLPYHLICLAEACRILPWLKEHGVQHVHAHFATNSAEIVMLARVLGGPPYSFTVHGPEEFDGPRFLALPEKIRRAAFVVAITSFTRSQLYRWVGHEHWPKIQMVSCGLEPEVFEAPPVQPPVRPRLVCIGRLAEQKGQMLLVEAAARLAAREIDFRLVLVGGGPLFDELNGLVRRYGLDSRVEFAGAVSTARVYEELRLARGLVLPSFAEGLPMVIMEAMALRRPVISTYIAGIPELVRDRENGWLIPAGSVEALEAAMHDLLTCPVQDLAAMGEAAHARVRELHHSDMQAAELAALFMEGVQVPGAASQRAPVGAAS